MDNFIALGQGLLFGMIVLFGSCVIYILCLLFIKLIDMIQKFTEWLENKLFNNSED